MMHPVCWSMITDYSRIRAAFLFGPSMEILLQSISCDGVRCVAVLSWRIYKLRANSSSTSRLAKLLCLSLSLKPQHKPEFGFFIIICSHAPCLSHFLSHLNIMIPGKSDLSNIKLRWIEKFPC
jgi:hypothetical protein